MTDPNVINPAPLARAEVPDEFVPAERTMTILDLIHDAHKSGTAPEALEKLYALYERMEDRDAAKEFAAAMMRFKAKCPAIAKNKTASIVKKDGGHSHSYSYADLQEIVRIVDPILAAEGLSYTWDSEDAAGKLKTTCIISHIDGHHQQASWTVTTETNAGMSAQQKVAAAFTFARRQTLVAALGLTTCDPDTDGAEVTGLRHITQNQVETIQSLLAELKMDEAHFLRMFPGVDSVKKLTTHQYPTAIFALNARKVKSGGGA